uniref:Decaprenyl-phosphate phosphoribosyltransferase n=1 Tax=candidate division WWE3 bacterium TaxID=2053526 RepID=A0A831Z2Y1_UNCKA
MGFLQSVIVSARPRQWLKNLAIFAAPFFGGELLDVGVIPRFLLAFAVFSLLSSAAYILNDVADRAKDRQHPSKKHRPIASGKLSIPLALAIAALMTAGTLVFTAANFNRYFLGTAFIFILLQLTYSLWLRNVIIIDALWVGMAFVLRVYAGAFVLPTPISSWLILATIGLSLLLAFGKRRSERTLLSKLHRRLLTRETLRHYPDALLDSTIAMSAAYTTLAYSIFAFQTSPTGGAFFTDFLPKTLTSPKWSLITVPLVIYGVARYLYIIYEKKEGESPEKVILNDLPLLGVVLLWGLTSFVIFYVL